MVFLRIINEARKNLIRKEIRNEPELRDICKLKILDNGAGDHGSWDYEDFQNITSCDITTGVDCQNLPYKTKKFDIVVLSGVIQYVENPKKALEECHRVLVKQGYLIISTINRNSAIKKISGWKDEIHKWTLEEFKKFVSSFGFKIIKEKMIDFKLIPNEYKMAIYLKTY